MNIPNEIYHIGLSILKGVSPEIIKNFPEKGISPKDFFELSKSELRSLLSIEGHWLENENREKALIEAKIEWEKIQRHKIKCIFLLDEDYPVRLFQIPDSPVVLYKIGNADLDAVNMASIVGTRKPTPYGLDFCNKFVKDLSEYFPEIVITSGLAYGIDGAAHKACLQNHRQTVAVVAHGLDIIYPASHRQLAKDIIRNGGAIISEYRFGQKPYRQQFLERNRIIAGISDVTVVVESDLKGGAMSTANTAFSYSRDVMAVPGRISDQLSAGCNLLIRKQKAHLLSSAADLIEITGWKPLDITLSTTQRNLFPELSGDAKTIYDLLRYNKEAIQLDRLHQLSLIPMPRLLALLGELEFDGIIIKHPGNRFSIA